MKIILLVLFFYCQSLVAQELKNTEWTQVKAERKDGSKIVDHLQTEKSHIKYYFKEKTVLTAVNNLYLNETSYSVNGKILSIGEFSKYQIDTIDSEILVLTQISKNKLPDDKINRAIFLNRHSLFQYLRENEEIKIIGDSIIEYSDYFAPTYYGNIEELFTPEFESLSQNKDLFGIYILDSKGQIGNIEFEENKKFSSNEKQKIEKVLKTTNGYWILPETPIPVKYKINFRINFFYVNHFSGIGFTYESKTSIQESKKSLTIQEIKEADDYFNKGNDFIQRENYEKASKQFIQCIKTDSLYVDAYYNLAFCYQKLGSKNLACETWNKLRNMGQKQAEYLYGEYCK